MEIKFRGKQVDSGEWYVGFYAKGRHGGHYILSEYNGLATNAHPVDGDTVGRWTGLKDKEDVDIFEGDKLLSKTMLPLFAGKDDEHFAVVEWSNFYSGFIGNLRTTCYDIPASKFGESEVIGNIHDNPKLLKETA